MMAIWGGLGRASLIASAALASAACGSLGLERQPELPAATSLPPPSLSAPAAQPDYRIGAFDTLEVRVFGVPDLSGEVQVDGAGLVSLPLIGQINAQGRTPFELADDIEDLYRAGYLRDPQVSVLLKQSVANRITVTGEVGEPGVFPVTGRVTLLQAIALAQGASQYADRRNVVVIREIDGQQMAARFNLAEIQAGAAQDPEIYAGDTVIVDNAEARQLIRDLAPLGTLFAVFRIFQ